MVSAAGSQNGIGAARRSATPRTGGHASPQSRRAARPQMRACPGGSQSLQSIAPPAAAGQGLSEERRQRTSFEWPSPAASGARRLSPAPAPGRGAPARSRTEVPVSPLGFTSAPDSAQRLGSRDPARSSRQRDPAVELMSEMQGTISQIQSDMGMLKEQKDLRDQVIRLEEDKKNLTEELRNSKRELDDALKYYRQKTQEFSRIAEDNQRDADDEYRRREKVEQELQTLKEKYQEMKKQSRDSQAHLVDEIDGLRTERDKALETLEAAGKDIRQKEKALQEAHAEAMSQGDKGHEAETWKQKYQEMKQTREDTEAQLVEEVEGLRMKLSAAGEDIARKHQELEDVRAEAAEQGDKAKRLAKELRRRDGEIEAARRSGQNAEQEREELRKDVAGYKEQQAKHMKVIWNLEQDIRLSDNARDLLTPGKAAQILQLRESTCLRESQELRSHLEVCHDDLKALIGYWERITPFLGQPGVPEGLSATLGEVSQEITLLRDEVKEREEKGYPACS